ncbi:MAG: MBL fold metallo-hydrolase [Chloroflexi bacterium]|nr:MBL fold metallo-hydrolase [Chloroflexota bacterium]MCY4246593.1 MBL fold metallo-hydrolase [Chloroflexota bacterium]
MQRERITDHIFVFRSALYAQVTAGLVLTTDGAVLIDTLLYPEETLRIRRYVEQGLRSRVRYIINTHYHADHTTGSCFFPDAEVVAHGLCRQLLQERGHEGLRRMQAASGDFDAAQVVLPTRTFEDAMLLELGGCRFELWHSPGHSPDSITCRVDGDTLFAADTLMPVPYFVDGNVEQLADSLRGLMTDECEYLVQGHGDVILRGEASAKISSDLDYLQRLHDGVRSALQRGDEDIEERLSLSDCGKSFDLLQGLVDQLHRQNIQALVRELLAETPAAQSTNQGKELWMQKRII